jgi:hypothetical protein
VLDAACDEFDFKAKVWTVPGDRAKNGKANVVPLRATGSATQPIASTALMGKTTARL